MAHARPSLHRLLPHSDRVLGEAAALTRATHGQLSLLHVARSEPVLTSGGAGPPQGHHVPPEDLADRRASLAASAALLRADGIDVQDLVIVTSAEVHVTLLEQADAQNAHYLVIGSHGRTSLLDVLLGSVTLGVLRHARLPVVVIGRAEALRKP